MDLVRQKCMERYERVQWAVFILQKTILYIMEYGKNLDMHPFVGASAMHFVKFKPSSN